MQQQQGITLDQPQGIERTVTEAFKVDTTKGTHNGAVSSQWFSRPADQRFTSLDALHERCTTWAAESRTALLDVRDIRVQASQNDPDRLSLMIPEPIKVYDAQGESTTGESQTMVEPSHWSFGQLCSLLSVPSGYLRKLPAPIAGINLQYAVKNFRAEMVKAYIRQNGATELRAATGPTYGRIFDHEIVSAVRKIAGNGTGDTRWKIPGVLDWAKGTYNPFSPVTTDSTTLFASDRDVFMFLVDDTHPIEIGKLPNGEPDLIFRGFYCWNSEVGSKTFGLAAFYLRGVCMNRNLWGVEGFQEITIRHSSGAPARFAQEAAPALQSFADRRTDRLLAGVQAAKDARVATNDDEAAEFLGRQGFNRAQAADVIATVLEEEQRPARSIWDFVQGITAVARKETHQDERIDIERRAGKLLDKVAKA